MELKMCCLQEQLIVKIMCPRSFCQDAMQLFFLLKLQNFRTWRQASWIAQHITSLLWITEKDSSSEKILPVLWYLIFKNWVEHGDAWNLKALEMIRQDDHEQYELYRKILPKIKQNKHINFKIYMKCILNVQ